jgi:hypothetical protein
LVLAALVAVTEQVPVPLVMVTTPVVETTEHAPVEAKVTAPVPLPPEVPTVKLALSGCGVVGMPVTVSVAWAASVALTVAAAEVVLP